MGVGALYKISTEFVFRGHSPKVRTPNNVALGYDVGKISAGCLVYFSVYLFLGFLPAMMKKMCYNIWFYVYVIICLSLCNILKALCGPLYVDVQLEHTCMNSLAYFILYNHNNNCMFYVVMSDAGCQEPASSGRRHCRSPVV